MTELSLQQPLEVITLGHPVLRQIAQPVIDVQAPALQTLIDQLIAIAAQRHGVGIAAYQVGVPVQLMIVASRPTPRYPDAPLMSPTALINPRIIDQSETIETDWEGCLSVPDRRGWVPRHQTVTVAYTDRVGQAQTIVFTGFLARIFQHEYDHFQGLVFLDRVAAPTDIVSEALYQQILTGDAPHPRTAQDEAR